MDQSRAHHSTVALFKHTLIRKVAADTAGRPKPGAAFQRRTMWKGLLNHTSASPKRHFVVHLCDQSLHSIIAYPSPDMSQDSQQSRFQP
eukprot:1309866-Amphidinium_carterae.1